MNYIFCIMCFFFFFAGFFFFFFSLLLISLNFSILLNWFFISCDFFFCFPIFLDWISSLFISFVLFISGSIILYSDYYLTDHVFLKSRFFFLVFLFVFSMFFLVLSPNFFSMLLGWDGLGLVSYCLVIFYQNSNSFCSGMITVLTNRVGDVFVICSICLSFSNGSFNYLFFVDFFVDFYISLFFLIASLTKSAQIPFSAWLPAAMAAPTPVSSLVHSSTLVTAGVYIIIRYSFFLSKFLKDFLFFISLFTMVMSGMCGIMETDLKKIIALSTLSQLGFMMSSLSMGLVSLSFFHLIVHACFKALMFMCAGCFIHSFLNVQDIRKFSLGGEFNNYNLVFLCFIFNVSNLSLCGFPFLSGFFSKDLILEKIFLYDGNISFYTFFFLVFGTLLTVFYGFRLFFYMVLKSGGFFFPLKSFYYSVSLSLKSMFLLFFFSIFLGFLGSSVFINPYYICLPFYFKVFFIYMCLFSGILCFFFSFFSKILKGFFFFSLGNLFFLGFLKTQFFMFKFLNLGFFFSKSLIGYVEWSFGLFVYKIFKNVISFNLNNSNSFFFIMFFLSFVYIFFFIFFFFI